MKYLEHIFDTSKIGYYSSGNFHYEVFECEICFIQLLHSGDNYEFYWMISDLIWNVKYKNNLTCPEQQIKNLLE